ncbi:unnamed protein product [Mytilus coruscus]|uniref:Reverse transcriptase domain-containing protein n=1 Tax=Mytilus coruscus TaxID=42192 RepID=A0A6J8DYH8_MYTCO|nr:unnamed protein product [Mytilus coruscus]
MLSFNINNVQIYRFCRVPFGVISSPFLLAATIDLHLRKYNTPVATKIQDNIYVDNLLTGVNTNDELKELYTESKNMFQKASMNLRDWCSNSAQFMSEIQKQDQAKRERFKVLGITWTIKDDKLSMSGPKLESLELSSTKREILQSIASIFDPLGFFSPVTLLGKLLLQTLWSKKVEWNFKLSENDCELWKEIAFDIKQIQTHTFDRYIGLDGKCSYQLLCFCDASTKAYACAIYLRHETDESCRVDLIYSKTRLAPIKKISIPRLELLAVIIGIRCLAFIESHLKITVQKKTLWTDSQCVIHWIASKKQMSTFVENRLKEIRKCTDTEFRYVSTDINPAVIASRGTHFSEIKSNNLWWNGPSWLLFSNDQWPTWSYNLTTENVNLYKSEIKPSTSYQQTELLVGEPPSGVNQKLESPYGMKCENFSSLIRLLRITAWVQRFIRKLKKDTISGPLTAKEIEDAKFMWIVHIQRKHFAKEIQDITKHKSSNIIRQLSLTIDNNGLIRCVGRTCRHFQKCKTTYLVTEERSIHKTSDLQLPQELVTCWSCSNVITN